MTGIVKAWNKDEGRWEVTVSHFAEAAMNLPVLGPAEVTLILLEALCGPFGEDARPIIAEALTVDDYHSSGTIDRWVTNAGTFDYNSATGHWVLILEGE